MSYSSSFGDRPRGGVGAVFALMIVIAVTLVAFNGWCLSLHPAPLALGGAWRHGMRLVHGVNRHFRRCPISPHG